MGIVAAEVEAGSMRGSRDTLPAGTRCGKLRSGAAFHVPALTTLAGCLRGLGERSSWRDEHATWWAASLSLGDLYELTRHVDLALVPYYVFMHLWVSVSGDSLTVLRLPSALAMATAGGLVGLLGRRMTRSLRGGLVAGTLFAIVPTVARYGQEARPYALAMLAALLSFLALLRALERPTPRRWVLYTVTVPLMGWSHMVALTALIAHLGTVLSVRGEGDRGSVTAWSAAVTAGLTPVVPLVVLASGQAQQIAWNTPAWNDIVSMPYMLFRSPAAAVVIGGAVIALTRARRWRLPREPGSGADAVTPLIPLALWALAPFLITVVTAWWLHLFLDRYLLFTVPAWILLATIGIQRLTARPGRGVTLVLIAVLSACVPFGREAIARNTPREPDYHSVATTILAGQRPGDAIAYTHHRNARRPSTTSCAKAPDPRTSSCTRPPSNAEATKPGSARTPSVAPPRTVASGSSPPAVAAIRSPVWRRRRHTCSRRSSASSAARNWRMLSCSCWNGPPEAYAPTTTTRRRQRPSRSVHGRRRLRH
ncbi:glycosyltransferase family 39 protein [Streptomyces toyocaensis]|uniref:glycosyltransferase family 39 protein n=1 Tax=Streptomyces toyocaensis TaxID=55952 RepID=UPI000A3DAE92|nr:glycosyltransferase family 39 protein [Streptomyces toyocaensis]